MRQLIGKLVIVSYSIIIVSDFVCAIDKSTIVKRPLKNYLDGALYVSSSSIPLTFTHTHTSARSRLKVRQ